MSTSERPDEDLVRCIACGRVYALGTRATAPGVSACPKCGSVSWIALAIPRPRTSAEGRKFQP